jgi:DNA-binding NtrC family response regulator
MGKVKILVIDDDQIVLDSCRRILVAEGFDVCLVQSAREALEVMRKGGVGLVIIDVKMPEYDGMHLLRKIQEQWSGLPSILMSGYPTEETIAEGFQGGAAKFIAKPFTPKEFLTTIRQVIEGQGHAYE